ncbi:MAG: tol-pal system protein YbgF [Candidatus Cloacimonetes bacterium]|nr:tol-pal system protein YbgF [Candidatus Cloacimonadota bacterium]
MKQFIILLCVVMLVGGCASHRAFKAEQQKTAMLEALLAEGLAELNYLRDETKFQREYNEALKRALEKRMGNLEKGIVSQAQIDSLYNEIDDIYFIMREYDIQFTGDIDQLYKKVDRSPSEKVVVRDTSHTDESLALLSSEFQAQIDKLEQELQALLLENGDLIEEIQDYIDDHVSEQKRQMSALKKNLELVSAGSDTLSNEPVIIYEPVETEIKDIWSEDIIALQEELKTLKSEMGQVKDKLEKIPAEKAPVLQTQSQAETQPSAAKIDQKKAVDGYNAAKAFYDKRQYERAITELENYLKEYPNSSYAPNARYWIAESYYASGNTRKAIREFETVVSKYPESIKVLDARVKIGLCYWNLGDNASAREELKKVISEHPDYYRLDLVQQFLRQIPAQ